MLYRALADLVLVAHLAFILFALLGGALVRRWRWLAWLHLPAVAWSALIEFAGWVCPLTPLENTLRRQGGQAGYPGGFVEHYLLPVIYPTGLTRPVQYLLGGALLALNALFYGRWWRSARLKPRSGPSRAAA